MTIEFVHDDEFVGQARISAFSAMPWTTARQIEDIISFRHMLLVYQDHVRVEQ